MPRLALALCVLWFVSLFVFRTLIQWKSTGSTGMNGFHGRVGSRAWFAGLSASLGLGLAPLGPLAALYAWPGGSILVADPALHLAGAVLALVGIAGALAAQISMGASWRIGVDAAERTALVTEGLFAWVRNPIFTFIGLFGLGYVLLVPNALTGFTGLLVAIGIEMQVRAVEEPHLVRSHGEVYRRYAARVGRFVPGIGRGLSPSAFAVDAGDSDDSAGAVREA